MGCTCIFPGTDQGMGSKAIMYREDDVIIEAFDRDLSEWDAIREAKGRIP